MREGGALLQGLASCGHRGRRLHTHYSGRNSAPGVALVRRLAMHYPDAMIAGILNRQGRKTAYGHRFQIHHAQFAQSMENPAL